MKLHRKFENVSSSPKRWFMSGLENGELFIEVAQRIGSTVEVYRISEEEFQKMNPVFFNYHGYLLVR